MPLSFPSAAGALSAGGLPSASGILPQAGRTARSACPAGYGKSGAYSSPAKQTPAYRRIEETNSRLRYFRHGLLALAAALLAGGAIAGEARGPVEEALKAAKKVDIIRAAVIARGAFANRTPEDADADAERQLRLVLQSGVPELQSALSDDDPFLRASSAWALGWLARGSRGAGFADGLPDTLGDMLAGMLADPANIVRAEAARALGPLGSRRHEALLRRSSADADASVRAAALESLGLMGCSWDAGVRGLSDASSRVQLAAAGLLARVEPDATPGPDAKQALVRALRNDSAVVRVCVATTLGRIGGEAEVGSLKRLAMEKDAMVSGAAVEALGDIGGPATEVLIDIADAAASAGDSGSGTAARAARALGRTRARAAPVTRALGRLLGSAPPNVARAAAAALGSIGGEGAKRILKDAPARRGVKVDVAVAAARLGEFGPSRFLLVDLSDPDPRVRLDAARGLVKTGNPVGFPALFNALESDDEDLRAAAGACLAVHARADIDCWEARPGERAKLAMAWRTWWLENRETLVVPGVRAEAPAGSARPGR